MRILYAILEKLKDLWEGIKITWMFWVLLVGIALTLYFDSVVFVICTVVLVFTIMLTSLGAMVRRSNGRR